MFVDESNLVYITFFQQNMASSINSGSYSLQETSADLIEKGFVTAFNNFLNTPIWLKLSRSNQDPQFISIDPFNFLQFFCLSLSPESKAIEKILLLFQLADYSSATSLARAYHLSFHDIFIALEIIL